MRLRKPWFRAHRDCWYVQHNGRQVLLAKGKKNKAEAQAAFHMPMLLEGDTPVRSESIQAATICDLFLDHSQTHHAPSSFESYKYFLQCFCDAYGRFNVPDIEPFHVTRWIDARKIWKGAKLHAIICVKRAFSWAEQQGLIAATLRSALHPKCAWAVI